MLAIGLLFLFLSKTAFLLAETTMQGEDIKIETLRAPPSGSKRLGRYEGRFPCQDCNAMKISLTLNAKSVGGLPTTFLLERVNVGKSNDRIVCSGNWFIDTKKSTQELKYISLAGDCSSEFSKYFLFSDKIAILLNSDNDPKVGNAQLNFTLYKVE